MTNQAIPAQAVEAAARALKHHYDTNGEFSELTTDPFVDEARIALAAANPHIGKRWHEAVSEAYVEGALSAEQANVMWNKNPYRTNK